MPVIVWAYPRGEAIKAKGGQDGIYAIDYAARVATELGADVVKVNFPQKGTPEQQAQMPKPYNDLNEDEEAMISRVIATAGRTLTLISGGEHEDDAQLLLKAQHSMEAGATGLIFGRNIWQRPYNDALGMARKFHELMQNYAR